MAYHHIVLLIRFLWLIYRIWHLHESNQEFMDSVIKSRTYGTLMTTSSIGTILKGCPTTNTTLPYWMRLSELSLAPEAAALYKDIWSLSHCLQDPRIFAERIMNPEIQDLLRLEGSASKDLVLWSEEDESLAIVVEGAASGAPSSTSWDIFKEGLYGLSEEVANYLWVRPSHTPLYDKWTEGQQTVKKFTRSYYQFQFLAIDITDELLMFQRKFQQASYTTWNIYSSVAMMSTDIVAAYYGGDTAVMIVEGAYQLANDVKK
jgi:hypothetical protein